MVTVHDLVSNSHNKNRQKCMMVSKENRNIKILGVKDLSVNLTNC